MTACPSWCTLDVPHIHDEAQLLPTGQLPAHEWQTSGKDEAMNTKGKVEAGQTVKSKCPNCGDEAERTVYDIGNGSGPELSCASCEWCWGANGQDLKPFTYDDMVREFGYDPMAKAK